MKLEESRRKLRLSFFRNFYTAYNERKEWISIWYKWVQIPHLSYYFSKGDHMTEEEKQIEMFINLTTDKFKLLPYQIAVIRYVLKNKQKFKTQENEVSQNKHVL